LYHLELQIMALESKLKMLTNPKAFDSQKFAEDEFKLLHLRKSLKEWIHNKMFLYTQSAHMDIVNRRVQRETMAGQQEVIQLEYHLHELRTASRQ
jgi:hypothetical protein